MAPQASMRGRRGERRAARRGAAALLAVAAVMAVVAMSSLLPGAASTGYVAPGLAAKSQRIAARAQEAERARGADEEFESRRRALLGSALVVVAGSTSSPSSAEAAEPKITARCAFDIKIGNQNDIELRRLVIGLFGDEAPVMTESFKNACAGTVRGPARKYAKYEFSDVKEIVKGKYITWADFQEGNEVVTRVQRNTARWIEYDKVKTPLAGEEQKTDETNSLRNDIPGRVSMLKGGGTYNFQVSSMANNVALDKKNVVIGQVLEGLDIIEDINKVGMYDNKPLKKIRVFASELLPP